MTTRANDPEGRYERVRISGHGDRNGLSGLDADAWKTSAKLGELVVGPRDVLQP
jgi:hypothetical protein